MPICKNIINVVNIKDKTINLAKDLYKCGKGPDKSGAQTCKSPPTQFTKYTPEQLRSICSPEPCDCIDPPAPPTTLVKLFRGALLITKVSVILGMCKWTSDLGVWGNTESTAELRRSALKKLQPVFGDLDKESSSRHYYGLTYNMATMWNKSVNNIFSVLCILLSVTAKKILGGGPKDNEAEEVKQKQQPPKK